MPCRQADARGYVDQIDKFQAWVLIAAEYLRITYLLIRYRRDVGDTLINAFYVLRDDMLGYYVSDIVERLSAHIGGQEWEVRHSA